MVKKAFLIFLSCCLSVQGVVSVEAQSMSSFLPSPVINQDFNPVRLIGLQLDVADPLSMNFILNEGDQSDSSLIDQEAKNLVRYFFASLSTPNDQQWVNLSPHEPDRIIQQNFSQTQMGVDLLEQDLLLKELSSSLMHPDGEVGRKFWEKIYQSVYDRRNESVILGLTQNPENRLIEKEKPTKQKTFASLSNRNSEKFKTFWIPDQVRDDNSRQLESRDEVFDQLPELFHKIWIVPSVAKIKEDGASVYIVEQKLKVMLESDYAAEVAGRRLLVASEESNNQQPATSNSAKEIMKNILLPVIEHEVNHGQSFAKLRQIYSGMILASWFKKRLRNSMLAEAYVNQSTYSDSIQQNKIEGIYKQYVNFYKTGAVDHVREEYDPVAQKVVARRYFSGGFDPAQMALQTSENDIDLADIYPHGNHQMEVDFADLKTPELELDRMIDQATNKILSAAKELKKSVDAREALLLLELRNEFLVEILKFENPDEIFKFYELNRTLFRVNTYYLNKGIPLRYDNFGDLDIFNQLLKRYIDEDFELYLKSIQVKFPILSKKILGERENSSEVEYYIYTESNFQKKPSVTRHTQSNLPHFHFFDRYTDENGVEKLRLIAYVLQDDANSSSKTEKYSSANLVKSDAASLFNFNFNFFFGNSNDPEKVTKKILKAGEKFGRAFDVYLDEESIRFVLELQPELVEHFAKIKSNEDVYLEFLAAQRAVRFEFLTGTSFGVFSWMEVELQRLKSSQPSILNNSLFYGILFGFEKFSNSFQTVQSFANFISEQGSQFATDLIANEKFEEGGLLEKHVSNHESVLDVSQKKFEAVIGLAKTSSDFKKEENRFKNHKYYQQFLLKEVRKVQNRQNSLFDVIKNEDLKNIILRVRAEAETTLVQLPVEDVFLYHQSLSSFRDYLRRVSSLPDDEFFKTFQTRVESWKKKWKRFLISNNSLTKDDKKQGLKSFLSKYPPNFKSIQDLVEQLKIGKNPSKKELNRMSGDLQTEILSIYALEQNINRKNKFNEIQKKLKTFHFEEAYFLLSQYPQLAFEMFLLINDNNRTEAYLKYKRFQLAHRYLLLHELDEPLTYDKIQFERTKREYEDMGFMELLNNENLLHDESFYDFLQQKNLLSGYQSSTTDSLKFQKFYGKKIMKEYFDLDYRVYTFVPQKGEFVFWNKLSNEFLQGIDSDFPYLIHFVDDDAKKLYLFRKFKSKKRDFASLTSRQESSDSAMMFDWIPKILRLLLTFGGSQKSSNDKVENNAVFDRHSKGIQTHLGDYLDNEQKVKLERLIEKRRSGQEILRKDLLELSVISAWTYLQMVPIIIENEDREEQTIKQYRRVIQAFTDDKNFEFDPRDVHFVVSQSSVIRKMIGEARDDQAVREIYHIFRRAVRVQWILKTGQSLKEFFSLIAKNYGVIEHENDLLEARLIPENIYMNNLNILDVPLQDFVNFYRDLQIIQPDIYNTFEYGAKYNVKKYKFFQYDHSKGLTASSKTQIQQLEEKGWLIHQDGSLGQVVAYPFFRSISKEHFDKIETVLENMNEGLKEKVDKQEVYFLAMYYPNFKYHLLSFWGLYYSYSTMSKDFTRQILKIYKHYKKAFRYGVLAYGETFEETFNEFFGKSDFHDLGTKELFDAYFLKPKNQKKLNLPFNDFWKNHISDQLQEKLLLRVNDPFEDEASLAESVGGISLNADELNWSADWVEPIDFDQNVVGRAEIISQLKSGFPLYQLSPLRPFQF